MTPYAKKMPVPVSRKSFHVFSGVLRKADKDSEELAFELLAT
jgi:hypothetical protein